jgi:hypothetical protein
MRIGKISILGKINQYLSVFLEGINSNEWGSDNLARSQRNQYDLHQAYLKVNKPGNLPFSLTLGRQEMKYGAQRLIAAPTWANNVRSFDAVKFTYNPGLFDIDVFGGAEVIPSKSDFDSARWGKYLFGVYATYKGIPNHVFDLYSINVTDQHDDITSQTSATTKYSDTKRYTVGTRGEGKIASTNFGYGYEFAYQFGNQDSVTSGTVKPQNIRAYAVHADVNYTLKDVLWQPVFKGEYNYASGDDDPADGLSKTFDPIYGTTHAPYGLIDFFRWQNMKEYAISVDATPIKNRLKATVEYHRYYLADTHDAWYNSSGTKLRMVSNGNASDYVGQELSLVLNYKVTSYLNLEGGYAHFYSGDYVKNTAVGSSTAGAFKDSDLFYLQTVLSF